MRDYKQTVRELRNPHFVCHFSRDYLKNMMDDAADAIEELCELVDNNKTAVKHGRWVPVSERLPKQGQEVICQCRASIIKVLKLDANGDWYQDASHCYMRGFVIAWMPLPEPYAEEGEAHETD